MIELDLTREEREVLLEILEADLSDLRMEIADTDSLDFRDMLKGRKASWRRSSRYCRQRDAG